MDINTNTDNASCPAKVKVQTDPEAAKLEELKAKYSKVYRVGTEIEVDDETSIEKEYFFKKPSLASYDRYVKTTSNGATKALKMFLYDSVCEESREALETDLEEYPALAMSIGEKLLSMMGLGKSTSLKLL